ncbi:hypothetical protein ACT7DC_04245 [Bacillus cereus]
MLLEGLTFIETNGNDALILELNSETDFVAKNEGFQTLIKELAAHLLTNKPANVGRSYGSNNGKR